jgi:hypothetical protein
MYLVPSFHHTVTLLQDRLPQARLPRGLHQLEREVTQFSCAIHAPGRGNMSCTAIH